ncbi:triacylglycerol lipase [Sarracenia purpurea var. burkii]
MLNVGSWAKPTFGITLLLSLCVVKWTSAGILDWGRAANKIEVNIPWLPFENETRCYDEIGCINITREWYHLIYRPLNVFPLPRQVIDTRFILYTRKNPNLGQMLKIQSERSIQKSNFDSKKLTKMIIHGFIDTPLASWVKEMRREFLKHADWNVIVVDWAGGSLPLYTQATANTRLVGLEVAYFINYLKDNHGLNPKDVHIIGHSLGAHTAGYAGERIDKLGRITGLDPAEPYFQGMPEQVRLDPNDADLVDVIHTDGSSIFLLGYGMSEPAGHVDFYPNNGKEQPGCDLTETPLPLTLIKEGIEEAGRVLVACNHGKCFSCEENNSSCAIMGLQSDLNRDLVPGSKYFIATGKEPPFCSKYSLPEYATHYKVTLDLARPPRAETWVQGFMKVTLHSDNGVIRNLDLTPK